MAHTQEGIAVVLRDGWANWEECLEGYIANQLSMQGRAVSRQVPAVGGAIDLLTDTSIYEVKYRLTRDAVFKAVGQLLIYSQDYPRARRYVLGYRMGSGYKMGHELEALGIHMMLWRGGAVPE